MLPRPARSGNECVRVLRVPEQPPRDRLEPPCGTARRRPEEPLGEVDQFMFHDALERFETVVAREPRDRDRTVVITRDAVQQVVVDTLSSYR